MTLSLSLYESTEKSPSTIPSSLDSSINLMFKIKFDGATFKKEGSAGLSVIIRNGDGQVMPSLFQVVPLPHSVINVEALAA